MLWLFKLNINELDKYLGIKVTYMWCDRQGKKEGTGSIAQFTSSFSWMDAWHLHLHWHLQGSTTARLCPLCPLSEPPLSLASAQQTRQLSSPISHFQRNA